MLRTKCYPLLAFLAVSPAFGAVTDVLYVTDGDHGTIQGIQGNAIIYENTSLPSQFDPGPTLYDIVVRDSIWLASYHPGEPGRLELDYTLNTTGNSGSVVLIPSQNETLDGAADGTYNYTIDDANGDVYRYNADWSGNPVYVFTAACSNEFCPGITYDPVSDSFWTADETNINQYSPGGESRGSFAHGADAGGLAYEPSTDTLWLVDNNGNTLRQYSKAGTLLDTVTTTTDYANNVWGAEFAAGTAAVSKPVPSLTRSGLILLAGLLGLLALVSWRRRIIQ